MSDIKSVLSLLCQHLDSSIHVAMKPEYFRLAKFNFVDENVNMVFWKALNILSYHAAKNKEIVLDFKNYDMIAATKLYFAYLQYPAIEFYAANEQSQNNRALLLAFAWILCTHNVLSIVTRINLCKSIFGKECSSTEEFEKRKIDRTIPKSISAQINHIMYLNGKANYNIKAISELIIEQTKLINKVHAASTNVSGLPHLSVSELALVKRFATVNKKIPSVTDKKYVNELSVVANLLEIYMKWSKKSHVFFDWMVTVVEEHNKSLSSSVVDIDWNEVKRFISLLHRKIHEKITAEEEPEHFQEYNATCTSRLLQVQSNQTEIDNWLPEFSSELNKETEDLTRMKDHLTDRLKIILKSIPSTVQVSF